jgi:hypothetical protein
MSLSKADNNGLFVAAYTGNGAVLLAFDLDENKTDKLAGFAIKCLTPDKGPYPTNEYFLKNRLSFTQKLTNTKLVTPENEIGSDKAPFQTFHWIHFPSAGLGKYQYTVYASYFKNDGTISLGQGVTINVDLSQQYSSTTNLGFTRGYISSQAYVDRFQNKNFRPKEKSINYDTTPYQAQYQWLGGHARELLFDFLKECQQDPSITVDVFSYDFDEPDVIRSLCKMGKRVRVFQDNAPLHTSQKAPEPKTIEALVTAGVQVKTGHFNRFAHDKVLIQRKKGKPVKVLTGSANFSLRGLYVQANSIIIFNDANVASLYGQAFDQAFSNEQKFKSSQIASQWYDIKETNIAPLSVSFAPHRTAFSLEKVSKAIEAAKSSIFFAVMQMSGSGPVLGGLETLGSRTGLFSLGIIESESQLKLFKPGMENNFAVTSFSFLQKNVPKPFKSEWRGGVGQVIHHKFVVCDFNGDTPTVFCGSSNLAAGGETSNGDNLLAIYDKGIVISYAVEAIRLFDHYRFRTLHEKSTSNNPLTLATTDSWTKPYYDPKSIKSLERKLFISKIS